MNQARARHVAGHRQRGQGLVEFIVAVVVFGSFMLGILQVALLYRAKTTVDYAAFKAAREGSMHGATQDSVNDGLVKGLAPLYATSSDVVGLAKALAMAKAAQVARQAKVKIISPTKAMFNQVAVAQFDGVKGIPNDSLAYRSDAVRAANLLKVKVTYDYPLIVPVIDAIVGKLAGARRPVLHSDGSVRMMWVLPIQAQAIVQMQSPIRDAGALASKGGGGGTGPGGGGTGPGGGTDPPGGGGAGDGGGPGSGGGPGDGGGGSQPPPHVCT